MDSPDLIFGTVFGHSRLNFRDYFQTVQVEFSGLFSNSSNRIFRQSGTDFRTVCVVFLYVIAKNLNNMLIVIPRLRSPGFFVCFGITVIR